MDYLCYVSSLTFGVSFQTNQKIEDCLGDIADELLFSPNAFYNPDRLSLIRTEPGAKILHSDPGDKPVKIDELNYFKINSRNIIICEQFDSITQKGLDEFCSRMNKYIFKGILEKREIKNVIRYGMIISIKITNKDIVRNYVKALLKNKYESESDVSFRFSRRDPIYPQPGRHSTEDYGKTIYSIVRDYGVDDIKISIDYQNYFVPPLDLAARIPVNSYLDRAKLKFNEIFPTYLDTLSD